MHWAVRALGKVIRGYYPALSIEITRECPLQCPGCYAYGEDHLGGAVTLRQVRDLQGPALIRRDVGVDSAATNRCTYPSWAGNPWSATAN